MNITRFFFAFSRFHRVSTRFVITQRFYLLNYYFYHNYTVEKSSSKRLLKGRLLAKCYLTIHVDCAFFNQLYFISRISISIARISTCKVLCLTFRYSALQNIRLRLCLIDLRYDLIHFAFIKIVFAVPCSVKML